MMETSGLKYNIRNKTPKYKDPKKYNNNSISRDYNRENV